MYMKSLDSFILASRDNWISCNQTLGWKAETAEFLERSLEWMLIRIAAVWLAGFFGLFFFFLVFSFFRIMFWNKRFLLNDIDRLIFWIIKHFHYK